MQGPIYHSKRFLDTFADHTHPEYIELMAQRALIQDCVRIKDELHTMSTKERHEAMEKLESANVCMPLSFQTSVLLQTVHSLELSSAEDVKLWWNAIDLRTMAEGLLLRAANCLV